MTDLLRATSAAAVISEHARLTPDRTALIFVDDVERDDGASQWSYAQLDTSARRIGAWLRTRFPQGERVFLLYPTGFDFVAAFVGCLYAGIAAVPAPLPGQYRHERLRVHGIASNAMVAAALTNTENLPAVTDWVKAEGLTGIPLLATDGDDLAEIAPWSPDDLSHDTLALLQYTSGSTGEPKGVLVSHGNLLHNVDCQRRAWEATAQTRVGGWLPLYHDMGLLGQTLPALMLGGGCVLMRPATFLKQPHHWLQMIDKFGISGTTAPNFAYDLCCARITDEQVAALDLSRWKFAVTGSEPVDAATVAAFTEKFAPAGLRDDVISPSYGLAETTLFVSGSTYRRPVVTTVSADRLKLHQFVPAQAGVDLVSCGTPDDFDVLIADTTTGAELPPDGIGEIWLRGPSVSAGYWRNEPAAERAFGPDGYLRTGDLGALHDGELYVTGRLDEMVVVHGRNLYPQDIERELRARHAELAGAGAAFTVSTLTVSTAEAGTEDVLVVTHEVNGRLAEDRLRGLAVEIKQTVAREFGVPLGGVGLLRRGGVRRTTSGKIQRVVMRQLFLDGGLNTVYADYGPRVADALRLRRPEPAIL